MSINVQLIRHSVKNNILEYLETDVQMSEGIIGINTNKNTKFWRINGKTHLLWSCLVYATQLDITLCEDVMDDTNKTTKCFNAFHVANRPGS